MGNYFDLIAAINAAIKTNGEQGITGASLNAILRDMVAALGAGYQYVGVVAPDAAAPSTDYNAVYLGLTAGTYTNFGGTQVKNGQFGVFTFNGSWTYNVADIASGTFVRCDGEQELTEGEKENARNNIDAASKAEVNAKYTKPDSGIPAADLAQAVQTSLGKADSALPASDVVDNLTTEDATKALSAKQGKVLDNDVSQLGQELTDLDKEVNGGETTITGWTVNYGVNTNQGVGNTCPKQPVASGALRYVIINIPANISKYIVTGDGTAGARLWCFLDSNDKILAVANSNASETNLQLPVPDGATQLILNTMKSTAADCYEVINGLKKDVSILAEELEALTEQVPIPDGSVLEIVETPSKIFGLAYANTPEYLDKLNFMHRIFIEGLAKGNYKELRVDGEQSVFVQIPPTGGAMAEGDYTKTIKVSCKGYNDGQMSVPISLSDPYNLVGKTMRIMHIGDSLTSDGIPCATKAILDVMADDYGTNNTLMVGNRKTTKDVVFAGGNHNTYACHVGYGGWSIANFLRHFTCTRAALSGVSQADVIYGKVAWDSLGLGTKTRNGVPGRAYVTYTAIAEQKALLRDTPHGYYDADPSAELWDWIVNKRGLSSFTYNGTTYTFGATYSAADDAAQKAAIKYLCENPENPFFDLSTVDSSDGDYAFDFATYLGRYKTLADDGTTRLIPGSTAGTRVVSAESWDVCTPTHVVIICAHNGFTLVSNGVGDAADMALMAQLIKSYDSGIKVSIGAPRRPGAFNPNAYNWAGYFIEKEFNEALYNIYHELKEIAETDTNFDFLALYPIQTIYWGADGKSIDTLDMVTRVRYVGDGNHARSGNSYLDVSSEVVAWLAYLFRSQ